MSASSEESPVPPGSRVDDYDYPLPPESIAQHPADRRDASRLLVPGVGEGPDRHLYVRDLPELLRPGDLLVLNDTRVLAARVFGRRSSGGTVEFLFVEPLASGRWEAMVNPARKLHPGEVVQAGEGALEIRPIERVIEENGKPSAFWVVELRGRGGAEAEATLLLERHGQVPLPPYIERERAGLDESIAAEDAERYQTVYAREGGAIAAPTAGLHFTEELLAELERRGIERAPVTLHVGPGTFRPVKVDVVADHRMHSERFHLPETTARAIERCRARGGRVVAVGTTTVRVLESRAEPGGSLTAGAGRTELFITPGFPFRVVDLMLTNFHLPRSTLLMMVSAFAGRERVLRLYREAVEEGYRFYSYGDAMLLTRRDA